MIFMLERNGVTTTKMVANDTHTDVVPVQDQSLSSLTVRCFGHSNAPILELFEDVEQMVINGTQLGVTKMVAGSADATTQRSKRLLSTIDLEPELKANITRDAEIFFSEDSREFHASIGQPYRRGYLLYGPPGTGKTSISVALSSHFNVPLVLLTLKGMSDKDLTFAFSRLPSTCIVLIEDVDCAGAEVENRDAKSKGKGKGKAESSSDPAVALEAAQLEMEQRLSAQQAAAQHQTTQQLDNLKEILGDELGIDMDNYQPIERRTGKPKKPNVTSSAPTNPNAKVSLSCLLNQIDGAAAAEGRLLILTTDCPEVLDAALLRAGRIDEKFKIDFATKVTAELTFKRIFGLDKLNKFKPATIDRFAQAFAAQFPSRSTICTAELAKYCGQYRGRPQAAIEEFADWLKLGDDMFAYRREDLAAVAAEGDFNVPEAFDPALLKVDAQDLAEDDTPATTAPLPVIKDLPSRWNPTSWFRGSSADNFASVRDELLAPPSSAQSTLFDSFSTSGPVTAAVQATCVANPVMWRNTSRLERLARIGPFTGFQATLRHADQHPRVFPVADLDNDSDASTKSADDATLTWVSPRPIDDAGTASLSSTSSEDIPHISLCDNDIVDDKVLPPLPADSPGDFPSSPPPSPATPSRCSLRHPDPAISTSQDTDLDEDEDVFFDAEE
jgi:hypothetical protein